MNINVDNFIIGASLFGIGAAVAAPERSFAAESGGLIGGEFINAFCERGVCSDEPETEFGRTYKNIMRERGIMSANGYIHSGAAMYALCDMICRYGADMLLYTRVIGCEREENGGYKITLFNSEGYSYAYAKRVVDTREEEYIRRFGAKGVKKYLNAAVSPINGADGGKAAVYNPQSGIYTYVFEADINESIIDARERFYENWLKGGNGTQDYSLTLLSNAFAYRFEAPVIREGENGIIYAPSSSFANILDAFDEGAKFGGAL